MKTAVIILGHGSRTGDADSSIKRVAADVKANGGFEIVSHAFLQYMQPCPEAVIEQCVRTGAARIVIVPFFLQPGAHVTKDVPALASIMRTRYPDVEIVVTDMVGSHPLMAAIVVDRARVHRD
jgi:sirohydrochlorin ferrochelatase